MNTKEQENKYFCKKCNMESICTKPATYYNCPCGEPFNTKDV
jgi:hypothetical protein